MKTKELIRQLQEADPSGEEEVSVGNTDIYFVTAEPAYYDGLQEVLIHDESNKPYYSICGAKLRSKGAKIVIHDYSIREALVDNVDLPIDYSEATQLHIDTYERYRREAKDINEETSR